MPQNKKNIYTCKKCSQQIVTIDIDEGTTPFFLKCRATPGCQGMMFSKSYMGVPEEAVPDYEWFKPLSLKGYNQAMRDHIGMGGLDIRKCAAK